MIFFLAGIVINIFAQGMVNDGGYISATSPNYVKFSGSGNAYLINSTAGRLNFGNLDVDFSGTGTYKLIVTDTSFITIDGSLSLSDTLRMKAGTSSMASLISNGSVSGSFAAVEQHISADQWHMISSPVSTATANVYAGSYLMKFDEPDSLWSFLIALTDPLTVSRGYFAWSESSISSPTDVEFPGLLNTGNTTVSGLSYTTGSGKGKGWNLVGNPYPSPIEWNSSWTKSNIDATVYIYDGTTYKTWNYFLGLGSMGNGYIPSTQAFWIKANAAIPSMIIPNSSRIHQAQAFYKSGNSLDNYLSLEITGNDYSDEMTIGMKDDATDGFDSDFDAYKLFGIEAIPQLYSLSGEIKMAVNILEETPNHKSVNIGIRTGQAGKYRFKLSNFEFTEPNMRVFLEDKYGEEDVDKLYDLTTNNEYGFYTEAGMVEDRFVIHLIKPSFGKNKKFPAMGVPTENIRIHAYQKAVMVQYTGDGNASVRIYDLAGRIITEQKLHGNQSNKITLNAKTGYYLIKVISQEGVKTEKVFME